MHRATPLNTSIRSYTAGGSRSVVDKVDDKKLMQEMGGNFMANETRSEVESPQNYGFTCVVFDAEKDKEGKVRPAPRPSSASWAATDRSRSAGPMDDRRHRLYKLEKGDTAMFRGRGDKQQFHMTKDGGFWTRAAGQDAAHAAAASRTARAMRRSGAAAVDQASGGGAQGARCTSGGGGSGITASKAASRSAARRRCYKDDEKSPAASSMSPRTRRGVAGKTAHMMLDDGNTYVHCHSDKNVYVGGEAGKGAFDFLVTLAGPASTARARSAEPCRPTTSPTSGWSRTTCSRNTRSRSTGSCCRTARLMTRRRSRLRSAWRSAPMRWPMSMICCPIPTATTAAAGGAISTPS